MSAQIPTSEYEKDLSIEKQLALQVAAVVSPYCWPINLGFIKLPYGYALLYDDNMPGYFWVNHAGHIGDGDILDKWATYHDAVKHSRTGRFNFTTGKVEWNAGDNL